MNGLDRNIEAPEDKDDIIITEFLKRRNIDCNEYGIVHTRFGNTIDLKQLIKSIIFEMTFRNLSK